MSEFLRKIQKQKYSEELQFLNKIRKKCSRDLNQEVALWIFHYRKNADLLLHWDMIHPQKEGMRTNPIVLKTRIPGGIGTIGYILRKKTSECVEDTFDDPRGTVAIEDTLIGNYAWCGVPIKDQDQKIVSIISFFPIESSRPDSKNPTWNNNIEKVKKTINDVIKPNSDHLITYSKLKNAIDLNGTLLKKDFKYLEDRDFIQNMNNLLDKIYEFSSRGCYFQNIYFLEKEDDNYLLQNPAYIRHDYVRTQLSALKKLQWNSIYSLGSTDRYLNKLFAYNRKKDISITIPLCKGKKVYQQLIYIDSDFTGLKPIIKYFRSFQKAFSILNTKANDKFRIKKIKYATMVSIHNLLFDILLKGNFEDEQKGQIKLINKFIKNLIVGKEYSKDVLDSKDIEMAIDILKSSSKDYLTYINNIIAVILWTKDKNWRITSFPKDCKKDIKDIEEPATWKVLQRTIDESDITILKKYKPLLDIQVPGITDNSNGTRTLSTGKIDIHFEKKTFNYPLDIRIHNRGIEKFIFNLKNNLSFRLGKNKVDVEQKRGFKGKTNIPFLRESITSLGLTKTFQLLACEDEQYPKYIIVIGPLKQQYCFNSEEIEEYSQKNFTLVLRGETNKEIRKHALRFGFAAIMSRNLSHNLGSHVLSNLLYDTLKPIYGDRLETDQINIILDSICNAHGIESNLLNFDKILKFLGWREIERTRFLKYLKARMDYVAEITTYWRELPWLKQLTL